MNLLCHVITWLLLGYLVYRELTRPVSVVQTPVKEAVSVPEPISAGPTYDSTTLLLCDKKGVVRHEATVHRETPPDLYNYGGRVYRKQTVNRTKRSATYKEL